MQKSELLRALQTEIHRHTFDYFVENPRPWRKAVKALWFQDVLPAVSGLTPWRSSWITFRKISYQAWWIGSSRGRARFAGAQLNRDNLSGSLPAQRTQRNRRAISPGVILAMCRLMSSSLRASDEEFFRSTPCGVSRLAMAT
jgi:hypothetical protein